MILKHKTAIITGAAKGIGKGIARKLAENGADIVVADIDFEQAKATANELEKSIGTKTVPMLVDVSKKERVQALVDDTIVRFGRLDIYVNNAAIDQVKPLLDVEETEWDEIFAVNVKGYLFGMQLAGKAMKAHGGSIVNIASASGKGGRPLLPLYAATKAVVISMTKSAAQYFGKYNIRVNAVNPGNISTDMGRWAVEEMKKYEGKFNTNIASSSPLDRDGTVDDIGNAVMLLSSDLCSYITGQNINVDGGKTMI